MFKDDPEGEIFRVQNLVGELGGYDRVRHETEGAGKMSGVIKDVRESFCLGVFVQCSFFLSLSFK
jgi:hypothetical protein